MSNTQPTLETLTKIEDTAERFARVEHVSYSPTMVGVIICVDAGTDLNCAELRDLRAAVAKLTPIRVTVTGWYVPYPEDITTA